MKREVVGCGGYTTLVMLAKGGGYTALSPEGIKNLENELMGEEEKARDKWNQILLSKKLPDFALQKVTNRWIEGTEPSTSP